MNKPKYQIGDRFTVMESVECTIIQVFVASEITYIFELFNNPVFKSVITEKDLDEVLALQPKLTRRVLGEKILTRSAFGYEDSHPKRDR